MPFLDQLGLSFSLQVRIIKSKPCHDVKTRENNNRQRGNLGALAGICE